MPGPPKVLRRSFHGCGGRGAAVPQVCVPLSPRIICLAPIVGGPRATLACRPLRQTRSGPERGRHVGRRGGLELTHRHTGGGGGQGRMEPPPLPKAHAGVVGTGSGIRIEPCGAQPSGPPYFLPPAPEPLSDRVTSFSISCPSPSLRDCQLHFFFIKTPGPVAVEGVGIAGEAAWGPGPRGSSACRRARTGRVVSRRGFGSRGAVASCTVGPQTCGHAARRLVSSSLASPPHPQICFLTLSPPPLIHTPQQSHTAPVARLHTTKPNRTG